MKCFLSKPSLYLAMPIIGSSVGSVGCINFRNRNVTQAQSNTSNTKQNLSNQVATQPNNGNFVIEVAQNVALVVRIDATPI